MKAFDENRNQNELAEGKLRLDFISEGRIVLV